MDPGRRSIDLTRVPRAGWSACAMTVLRAGKVAAAPNEEVARAHYPGQDILYCLSGAGAIDSAGRHQRVGEGDIAWLANEAPHAHRADGERPWTLLWCRVDGPDLVGLRRLLFPTEATIAPVSDASGVLAWFERVFQLLRAPDVGTGVDVKLNALVGELIDAIAAAATPSGPRGSVPRVLADLLTAMRAQPEAPWSAQDMRAVTGLSPAQTRRLFVRHVRLPPRAFLRRERLLLAQRLIAELDLPLAVVAARCGFSDVYHFAKAFRQETGMTPGMWRSGRVGIEGGSR